jgi:tRNA A-37 threonylcarbamoyl transferase component Bud32
VTSFPSPPGEPIAAGREADVFALDDERVLRRYRSGEDVTAETAVMRYAAEHGYPVPRVHAARGPDLILERLHGPTMGEALVAGQLAVPDAAAMTADLLRRLHDLPRPILHLDLHPENVLLTERGPVVIDWRNATEGPADLDTAMSALILAQVAIGSIVHPLGTEAGRLLDLFLALAPGDPVRLLDDAVARSRRYRILSVGEIGMLDTAADRVRKGR